MSAVQPLKIAISDERLDWIRDRATSFDWDNFPDAGGWSAGMDKQVLRRIVDYWTGGYDWRSQEDALNLLPHFQVATECGNILFIHMTSPGGKSRPPIPLLHGWPGSFLEFREAAERLAFPERFGGNAEQAFDLVIPSLPGFGLSGPPSGPIGTRAVAACMHKLMTETLGYERYIAQGGDWGSTIGGWIAHDYPDACAGLHLNMIILGHAGAEAETEEERKYRALQVRMRETEGAYAHQQRTRPQTLNFALQDSPVGAAAWILEKFAAWSDVPRVDGVPDMEKVYPVDHLLTNVMLYVATGSMATSTWLYFGNTRDKGTMLDHSVAVPTAVAAFPDPVFPPPPRSLAAKSYNIVRWTRMAKGGHFAAMEQPEAFANDVRDFALGID